MIRFECPIYLGAEILVSYGLSRFKMSSLLASTWCQEADILDAQGSIFTKGGKVWIWTAKKDPALLTHEVIHAGCQILNHRGIPINYDNDEVLAYLCGYIMDRIYKKIARTERAKSKE